MKKLYAGIALFALLAASGISNQAFAQSSVDQTRAETKRTDNSTSQARPDVSCEEARKNIADMMKRYDSIKRKIYTEWQQAHDAGRYQGSWDQYAREHFDGSSEVQELRKLHETYNQIASHCGSMDKTRPVPSDSQRPADVTSVCREAYDARKKLVDLETRYGELKTKLYNEWKRLHDSGAYSGDWGQYAEEKFTRSPEIQEMQQLRERYNNLVSQCQNARPAQDRPVADNPVRQDASNTRPVADTNFDELQSLREENKKLREEVARLKSVIQEQLSVIMDILSRMKSNLN